MLKEETGGGREGEEKNREGGGEGKIGEKERREKRDCGSLLLLLTFCCLFH